MNDYLAIIANCTLRGVDFSFGEKDGRSWKFRDLIRLQIEGKTFELYQEKDLPLNYHKLAGFVQTTQLYVRNVVEGEVERVKESVMRLCEMLSFATESRVVEFESEYPAGSGQKSGTTVLGTIQTWRPPFNEPKDAARFLEDCYEDYKKYRDRRKLNVVIDYIHHSVMRGLAEEVKIGLACIAFENLRDNWARDSGYPFINGSFYAKMARAQNKGQRISLAVHLAEMFAEVGMGNPASLAERIVKTRNEVLHTGLYGNLRNEEIHDFLETTLREYFLRLVGYKGYFSPYVGGSPALLRI